jgi:hypothetical protein
MKTNKTKIPACPRPLNATSTCLLGTLAVAVPLTTASAWADDAPEPSRVHALVSVDFANEYVTPRGMLIRDQGLTVQPLFLGLISLYKGDSFINSATLIPGVWNDLGTRSVSVNGPYNAKPTTPWTEVDPIFGIEIGFAKHFTLDVTYTAFVEQILSIGTSEHLDTKLSFDDSSYFKGFGFHPYVEYWQELDGKATDADLPYTLGQEGVLPNKGPGPGSSYYFQVGVDPTYTFDKLGGLKMEVPVDVLLPSSDFYGEYYSSPSTVGLVAAGVKGTLPLNFMPKGYGHWSVHAGVKYLYFVDDNLYNLNSFNAPGKPTRDTWQGYVGVSIFF